MSAENKPERPGLPSAADLDAVAEEKRIAEETQLDSPTVADPKKPTYNPLPAEVQAALEFTIQMGAKHGVVIAGYAFSATPPRVTNFGNCKDCGDLRLYVTLCEWAEKQREAGLVFTEKVLPIQ